MRTPLRICATPRGCQWARAACLLALLWSAGGPADAAPPKRARPPKFGKDVTDVFYPDANKALVGKRPQKVDAAATRVAGSATPPRTAPMPAVGGPFAWPSLIAPEAIEDEIKLQQRKLAAAVQNAATFKGGDYQPARESLSLLAALFAMDAEYGKPLRWQREAAGVRDFLARAGSICKVGTDATYKEAKARSDDLSTLIGGGTIEMPKIEPASGWENIADRSQLMKRLEQAHEQRLAPLTASAHAFSKNLESVWHEAQIVAALAEVIQREGYEFADDPTYREFAVMLRAQALAVRDAAKTAEYEPARQAVGEIGKACASCHEGYRN